MWKFLIQRAWPVSKVFVKIVVGISAFGVALVTIFAWWPLAKDTLFPFDKDYRKLAELGAGFSTDHSTKCSARPQHQNHDLYFKPGGMGSSVDQLIELGDPITSNAKRQRAYACGVNGGVRSDQSGTWGWNSRIGVLKSGKSGTRGRSGI